MNQANQEIAGLPDITTRRRRRVRPTQNSADIETANILAEGVKRQHKPSKRHDEYITQQSDAGQGSTDAFHDSFAALSISLVFCNDACPAFAIATTLDAASNARPITRTHRDNLPPEPKGFKQLAKHPYCEFFKDGYAHRD